MTAVVATVEAAVDGTVQPLGPGRSRLGIVVLAITLG